MEMQVATKVRNIQTVKADMVIFATSNSTERLRNQCSADSQFLKSQNIRIQNLKPYQQE